MLPKNALEQSMEQYIKGNIAIRREKAEILKKFREIEQEFKNFEIKLSLLEQRFHELQLKRYKNFSSRILSLIVDFDPYNMSKNIQRVEEIIAILDEIAPHIEEANVQAREAKAIWRVFQKNNSFLRNRAVVSAIESDLQKIDETIETAGYEDLRSLVYLIEKMKRSVKSNIERIEALRVYYDTYFFAGENAMKIKKKIEKVVIEGEDLSIVDFFKELENLSSEIEEAIKNSQLKTIAVPVVKIVKSHSGEKDIFEFGLRFGDFVLDFSGFLDGEDVNPRYEETKEMMFFKNIPYDGIFDLQEVFDIRGESVFDPEKATEKYPFANFDDKYIEAVETYHKKAYNNFLAVSGIAIAGGGISAFISLEASLLNAFLSVTGLAGYVKYAKTLLKKDIEERYGRRNFFLFSSINMVVSSIGHDVDIREIGNSILANIDDTIGNPRFKEWFEREGAYYVGK